MAILSNINGKFAVESSGAIQLSGSAGASGYVLKSNGTGNAASWVDPTTIIGGPYLPLSGGTLTGATATASNIAFTVGGTFTVTGKFQTTSTGAQVTGSTFTVYHPSSATKLQFIQTNGNWKIEAGGGTNKLVFHSESLVEDYLTIKGGGQIQLNDYGSGSHTGTTAYTLAVDSSGNIIETTDGGGDITGSGTTNTVAKFTGAKAIGNGPVTFSGNDSTFAGDVRVSGGVTRIISNQIQAGYNQNVDNTDIWINYTGYLGGSTYFRDFRVGNGKTGQIAVFKGVSSSVGIGHNSPNSKLSIVGPGADNAYSGVIGIENSSSAKWGYITFTDDIDTISSSSNYYLIGRGQSYTDRHFSFHVPRASDYGSGSEPKFIFASTGADQLFTIEAGTGKAYHKGSVGIGTTSPSAKLDIESTSTSTVPVIEITNTSSITYNHSINAFAPNLTANQNNIFIVGKSGSTKNSGYIGYKWKADASDSNILTFGHWASDNLMNLTGDGKLGIGTESPTRKLHVEEATTWLGRFAYNANNYVDIRYDGFNVAGGDMVFENAGSEKMRITSTGNVGIGTTSPSSNKPNGSLIGTGWGVSDNRALEISAPNSASSGANSGLFLRNSNSSTGTDITSDNYFGNTFIDNRWDNDNGDIYFRTRTAGTPQIRMIIEGGGNVGIGTTSLSTYDKLQVIGNAWIGANATQGIRITNNGTNASIVGINQALAAYQGLELRASGTNGQLFLATNGNIGIGETSPQRPLHINGTEGVARFTSTASGNDGFEVGIGTSSQAFLWQSENSYMQFATNNTERMRIDSGGSILIGAGATSGTPASDYRSLEIGRQGNTITGAPWKSNLYLTCNGTVTAGSTAFTYRYANEAPARMDLEDGNITFYNAAAGTVGNTISFTERMRITSLGRVDIGTRSYVGSATTTTRLYLEGNTSGHNLGQFQMANFSGGFMFYLSSSSPNTNQSHQFYNNRIDSSPSIVGSIAINSTTTSFNTTGSDERSKKNIEDWNDSVLSKFESLQPKKFHFNFQEDTDDKDLGFIAQNEVGNFPEAYPLTDDDGDGKYRYKFNPSGMVVYLMKAIQELEARVKELENK